MINYKQYGRKWKISFVGLDEAKTTIWFLSDSDFESKALKCEFTVHRSIQVPCYSDISIYNLAGDTLQDILAVTDTGGLIVVEAGYQNGSYGTIFEGMVFQPLFDRMNVVDNKLTLHCIDGLNLLTGNICNTTVKGGYDYVGLLQEMARVAAKPFGIEGISPKLSQQKLPRGKTIFGDIKDYLRELGRDQNVFWWFDLDKLSVAHPDDLDDREATVISQFIGSPQQTTNGVNFTVLMSPELKVMRPWMIVEIDNSVIRQVAVNQGMQVAPLDLDGMYKIIATTHHGDTRGTPWYTEVVTISKVGKVPAQLWEY